MPWFRIKGDRVMIRQYKIRDINRNPELHKEVFILYADMKDLLNSFVNAAVEAGADGARLMEIVGDE